MLKRSMIILNPVYHRDGPTVIYFRFYSAIDPTKIGIFIIISISIFLTP